MRNVHFTKASFGCLLCLLMLLSGCTINFGSWDMQAKHERIIRLEAPLPSGSTFTAETHNGSITAIGADVANCSLVATIVARAGTDEEARELAEEVEVTLEPLGDGLTARINKPTRLTGKSVSVNLDVELPNLTDLDLVTHNGLVNVTDIEGRVNARTHNGEITTNRVSGAVDIETHNGSIICVDASDEMKLKTHNGSVKAFCSDSANPVGEISIITHNGGIELAAPSDISAKIDAKTSNGSINTDLPITVVGKVSKQSLIGTIGSGKGRLYLETHNGSIRIR